MPTIQEMADMAARWATSMADAMIVACVRRHYRTGEPLTLRGMRRGGGAASRQPRVIDNDGVDWERLMRENSDTRWVHC